MNVVLEYLVRHRRELSLGDYGDPSRLSCVLATPRYRASRHVVFFVLAEGRPEPILVAKVPRLAGAGERLDREAENLRNVQAARAGGFQSIPRVIAFEDFHEQPVLIETALSGRPMSAPLVRRKPEFCIETVMDWLIDLHSATAVRGHGQPDHCSVICEQSLARFRNLVRLTRREEELVGGTEDILGGLRTVDLPLVFEHGDLSSPNILLLRNGGAGVVDWELAHARSLPALDLFFFLTFVAFARRSARRRSEYLSAFHDAFFGGGAWARPYVLRYAEQLGLPAKALQPLFILCWSRYVNGLLSRLSGSSLNSIDQETAEWLRENRFYLLWEHAVTYRKELQWMQ
jgi:aminoglycoside phosphotransferase